MALLLIMFDVLFSISSSFFLFSSPGRIRDAALPILVPAQITVSFPLYKQQASERFFSFRFKSWFLSGFSL